MAGSQRSSEGTLDNEKEQNERPQDHQDGGEKANGRNEQGTIGFWNKELRKVRLEVFKKWVITTLILSTFILAVLSLYWAVLLRVPNNMGALVVWVVDFDGQAPYTDITPMVGPQLVAAGLEMNSRPEHLGWINKSPADFNFDPMAVRNEIYHEKAWAAIIVNANATALLQEAVMSGNSTFDPMGIAQTIYIQARDETTLGNYVIPVLMEFQTTFASKFGRMWTSQALEMASTTPSIMSNIQQAPQALSPAIGFSTFNLRPFYPPVATPAITIGLIYLIIISFFSFSFYLPIHMKFISSPGHRPLHFYQLIIWRLIATVCAYFVLSLFYSLISLAFQIPFSAGSAPTTEVTNPATAYGKGSFVVYWMLNWIGMIALGLACENVAMVVGQPWMAFWLIFWVITNVSTSFYNIDLAPAFYRWGYAWPLHNIVSASRTILFDIHSRIGLNFGVLFAWAAVNFALFPFCCYFMRWKTMRQKKKEAADKEQ